MTKLWNFFASTVLTIILSILICLIAVWGSLLTVRYPEFYRSLDQVILLPRLLSFGANNLSFTLWIYILIVLIALFAINTAICTTDRVFSIIRNRSPWQTILPHIVHIGFLIALLGHLLGSSYGFKSPENFIMKGDSIAVPNSEGLKVRLDDVVVEGRANSKEIESLKTTVTLIEGAQEILTGDIEINGPLIYKGIAFYHLNHGQMPMGLVLRAGGEIKKVAFDSSFETPSGDTFKFGVIYPDFALDGDTGQAYSRSGAFRNPAQEIISGAGNRGYLAISRPGSSVTIDGTEIVLEDFILDTYVVLSINKDPGIGLIIAGSLVLTFGIILIFIFRGGRAELIKKKQGLVQT